MNVRRSEGCGWAFEETFETMPGGDIRLVKTVLYLVCEKDGKRHGAGVQWDAEYPPPTALRALIGNLRNVPESKG